MYEDGIHPLDDFNPHGKTIKVIALASAAAGPFIGPKLAEVGVTTAIVGHVIKRVIRDVRTESKTTNTNQ